MKHVLALVFVGLLTAGAAEDWDERYHGTKLPESGEWPWGVSAGSNTTAAVEGDCLRVSDRGTAKGQLRFYNRQWHADSSLGGVVEARLKVCSCSGQAGVILMIADGANETSLTFYPDHVEFGQGSRSHAMNTADEFHTYRLELRGTRVTLSVDGRQVVDEAAGLTKPAHNGRNHVGFGSCSSAATGEALWKFVRHRMHAPAARLAEGVGHIVVYKKPEVYACFPGLMRLPDGALFTSFGTRVRRSHIDGTGGGAAYCSRDGGRTWQPTQKGVTNPLFLRRDGGMTYATAYGWREVPAERAAEFRAQGLTVRDVRPGVVAYLSGAYSFLRRGSEEKGKRTPVATPAGSSLMNYNTAALCVTRTGVRLNAIYGRLKDGSRSTSFVLRSADDGETWELVTIAKPMTDAKEGEVGFDETAIAELPDGRVMAMMRPDPDRHGYLYQSVSDDGGKTWSRPVKTPMWGYPAQLLALRDGRLLCSYGYRRAPMGIRACLSRNGGRTWDIAREFVLRADGKRNGSDLGYPLTTELEDGMLLTIYYFTCGDGITHIAATRWKAPRQD
ncbi:MAG: exo-alpha-sialidase [Verrucomicrobia bacterium]|nr:exo-alpha-sialidase [Verrucomicrobiota bacterium]